MSHPASNPPLAAPAALVPDERWTPAAFVRQVAETSGQLAYVFDLEERRNVFATEKLSAVLGYTPEDAQAMGESLLVKTIHPEDLDAVARHHHRLVFADDDAVLEVHCRMRRADGEYRWIRCRETPFRRDAGTGRVVQFLGFAEDVTEKRLAETALVEANARLAGNLAVLERHHRQLEVLAEMGELLQTARNVDEFYVVADRYVRRLFPERRGFLAILETARDRAKVAVAWGAGDIGLGEPGRLPAADCWAMRQGRPHICQPRPDALFCPHADSRVPLATACVPLSAQGDLIGVFHVASRLAEDLRDVWPLVRMAKATAKSIELSLNNLRLRERLREQAFRDPLTDLYNRRYMEDALQREIYRARRSRGPVSMLVVDVDHFKRLNDTRGHDAGDEVLRRLGEIFASAVRDSDIACRFGGEEFALVLPDCAARVAARKAERIRGRIEEMVVAYGDDRISGVTVSVGVATTGGDDGWSGRDLFRAADRALYAAKRAGRNQVIVYWQRAEPLSSVPPGSDAVPTEPPTRVVEGLPPAPVRIREG